MDYALGLFVVLLLAAAFRFRGGGFVSTGSDTLVRAVWAACVAISYALLTTLHGGFSWFAAVAIYVMAWVAVIIVDHSMAQNMGRFGVLQCRWYTRWLVFLPCFPVWGPLVPPTEGDQTLHVCSWGTATVFQKTLFDALQMVVVGLMRGALVFMPVSVAMSFTGHWQSLLVMPLLGLVGTAMLGLLQPLSYFAGWLVPFTIVNVAVKNSTEWAELFNGAAWGVALLALFL